MEFKIKTNIKNVPTYLINDGIELGYLKNKESRYYYFDYVNSNSSQDVYLYNKGNVMIETFILQGERALETYQRYDIYDFEYKNTTYRYDSNLIFNNREILSLSNRNKHIYHHKIIILILCFSFF